MSVERQRASLPGSAHRPLLLDSDRCFDPDPAVRRIARTLYEETRTLPIVSPHGHVDPALLAEDAPFPEPTSLLVTPDHYLLRMLYSQGIALERLGISSKNGGDHERDPRRIWHTFASHWHLFRATPSSLWLGHTLHDLFDIRVQLTADSADRIYDEILEKLRSPEFRPRALFERFGIEVLATTDAATDTLEHHRAIRSSGWTGRVVPTFRPDALFRIGSSGWCDALEALGAAAGVQVLDYGGFVRAIAARRLQFRALGATATDHGVTEPHTARLSDATAAEHFQRGLDGAADAADQRRFEAHMLMEMARLSLQDGLVMQLHAGALRDHNEPLAALFGANIGGDIPVATEFTRNLRPLLNAYGNDPRLTLVLFTLDETTYARELAPLAGHYPAVRLGPAWWFHDSVEGMTRYRQQTTETAGIYNTAGFNDDTRAFCSIPARHDLARRVDANFLAGLVARHLLDVSEAREMACALAYGLAKSTYRFDDAPLRLA